MSAQSVAQPARIPPYDGLYIREDFGDLLHSYRQRLGVNSRELGARVGIDRSYLERIEAKKRPPPPRVALLGLLLDELNLTDYERDKLLVAGGYAPRCVEQLGTWPRVLDEIAHRMLDLPEDERMEFVYVIARIAIRYGAGDATREELG